MKLKRLMAALTFAVGLWHGNPPVDLFMVAVALVRVTT